MSGKILVANWKANKNLKQAVFWLEQVAAELSKLRQEIILCPPTVFLIPLAEKIRDMNLEELIKLGNQNVSHFPLGSYTGEVTVEQLSGVVNFSIVGHSERRKYFFETEKDVIEKIKLLLNSKIRPILCVGDLSQLDSYLGNKDAVVIENSEEIIFVYEPPAAISGGGQYHPESPAAAEQVALSIKEKIGKPIKVIYGGSINPDNVRSFFLQKDIDGGLIGQASLDPKNFIEIAKAANF